MLLFVFNYFITILLAPSYLVCLLLNAYMLFSVFFCFRTFNRADVFYWDATALPLKDNSVDVFVTDMVR